MCVKEEGLYRASLSQQLQLIEKFKTLLVEETAYVGFGLTFEILD